MSYNTKDLMKYDINNDINALHDIIHNINQHRIWWKTALIISLGFIGLGFIFIWVLYAVNENKTKEFDALIYSSASILIIVVIILSLLFFYRNSRETNDFGGKIKRYIDNLNMKMQKQQLIADMKLQEENKKTRQAMKATEILSERSRQSAIGAADRYVR